MAGMTPTGFRKGAKYLRLRNFVTAARGPSSKMAMRPMSPYSPERILRRSFCFTLAPLLLMAALALNPNRARAALTETNVTSPDGSIQFRLTFKNGIGYEVSLRNTTIIEPSRLSFSLGGTELTAEATAGDVKTYHL